MFAQTLFQYAAIRDILHDQEYLAGVPVTQQLTVQPDIPLAILHGQPFNQAQEPAAIVR